MPISHNVRLIPQPTRQTCWAAAVAMLKGTSVSAVVNATPRSLILPNGSIANFSGQSDWVTGTKQFAKAHGLRYGPPMSWTTEALYSQLASGPIAVDILWDAQRYASGRSSSGHLVVIVGMSSRGSDAEITINDPWPPNTGDIVTRSYAALVQDVPTLTYRTFWL